MTKQICGFSAGVLSLLTLLPLSSAAPLSVVINEVHYKPDDNTSAEEFLELHNPTGAPIDVSGWKLRDGIEFTMPNGTTIPAGGFVVVAENPTVLLSTYGVSALGPYTGGLNSDGERIELEDAFGVQVDEVNYGVGFPWPTSSRGAGSSMELINPCFDNDLGGCWRSSGSPATPPTPVTYIAAGSTGWIYRKGTSEASNPVSDWRQIGYSEDGSWLSGQTSIGYGDGDDATVLNDMEDGYWSVYLRKTFTLNPQEIPGQVTLRIYVDDGCVVWLNGTEVGRFHVPGGQLAFNDAANNHDAEWEEITINNAGAILGGGTNVLAIHALNSTFSSSDFSMDAELKTPDPGAVSGVPTPGAANSVFSANAPPRIRQVAHLPQSPTALDAVTITAKITDPDGVGPVSMGYQMVDPGSYIRKTDAAYSASWTNLAMRDDGINGDVLAGDSIYSVVMPAALHNHRRLVRYRITFEDTLGNSQTVPYADDEQPNFGYFVHDGVPAWSGASQPGVSSVQNFPSTVMDDMPVYHLIANENDVINSQYSSGSDGVHMQGTMVYEGVVYDHIEFENRGEASTYQSGKNKWRFHFNRARRFGARDSWGKKYKTPWNRMNFDACASPWAPVHRGMAGVEEAVSYRLYTLAGIASPRVHYVHFRIVDDSQEASPSDQYEGDLWGLYTAIEHPDGSFLNDRGLPDGNVYKIEGSNGDKKHQGPTQSTSSSDWNSFRSSSGSTQNEAYWRANMDLPAYYTFRACNRILGNVDVREGYNHYFYHNPNGQWMVMPWDCDMMFIAETHWSGTIQQKALLNNGVLETEYENRCRELLDLMCSDPSDDGGQIAQLIDEYADMVNPQGQALTWSDVDEFMWNYHPRTRGNPSSHSGQGNHKGNWFYTPFTDSRRGGSYVRTLASSDHEGSMQFLKEYATDTFSGGSWSAGNGNQRGYGYEYLKQEASDSAIPNKPTISYAGTNFGTDDLVFQSGSFSDPQGSGSFSAMKWRIAEIANPSTPNFDPTGPRKYEIETVWESEEITPFASSVTIPVASIRVGRTYRVRVRHKDNTGRWSHWSDEIQFVTSEPDLSPWTSNLVVTELMYHPSSATPAELAAGFSNSDFEWLELKNISATTTLDLTELRFTKGVDFDFAGSAVTSLAPGAYVLLVRNIAAFEARHGTGLPVAGAYGPDNLSNGGEQVKLSFGQGSAIRDFVYDDQPLWPTAADGGGYSLTLVNPQSAPLHADPLNWRCSVSTGGSPGTGDATTFSGTPGADGDGDKLEAFFEYALGTSDSSSSEGPGAIGLAFQDLDVGGFVSSYLTLSFPRSVAADDVSWSVEVSDDLVSWSESSAVFYSESHNGDGTSTMTFRLESAQSPADLRKFMRLRVSEVAGP